MCGFAGLIVTQPTQLVSVVRKMTDAILHRGPDDAGLWVDENSTVALGHRRLSIVDLSAAGHQPMASHGGRYVLVFNGEIYNHLILRQQLEKAHAAPLWRGHSDTETLLAAIEHWGLERTLQEAVGMFALALWDTRERALHLARDRFGEKPLYYGWVGEGASRAFAFGSELKALRAVPGFANPVSRQALAQYMRFLYVPTPLSIYQDIYKLQPGHLLTLGVEAPRCAPVSALLVGQSDGVLHLRAWWQVAQEVQTSLERPITDDKQAVAMLDARLSQAVKDQSLADVPLGAFLSGGVDSSAVAALMQKQSMGKVKTYTIGFEDSAYDESSHALAVAQHLGTEHTQMMATEREAQAVIARLPKMYDEPFADSSQIPTHLVCQMARRHVTVALSGDAADELFGGYNRYLFVPRIWGKLDKLPHPIRQVLGVTMQAIPEGAWDAMSHWAGKPSALGAHGVNRLGEKVHKLARRMHGVRSLDDLYLNLVSEWLRPEQVVRMSPDENNVAFWPVQGGLGKDLLSNAGRMMLQDSMTYLPDDILCKVDRAAMAVSLETRVPYLDHRVAQLAWQLPPEMKIRNGQGKWALRQVLYQYVPKDLIERPKTGFGIPVGKWLRGALKDWAEALLDEALLREQGYFYPQPIRQKWMQHLSGRYDHTASLWAVLMFQSWLQSLDDPEKDMLPC